MVKSKLKRPRSTQSQFLKSEGRIHIFRDETAQFFLKARTSDGCNALTSLKSEGRIRFFFMYYGICPTFSCGKRLDHFCWVVAALNSYTSCIVFFQSCCGANLNTGIACNHWLYISGPQYDLFFFQTGWICPIISCFIGDIDDNNYSRRLATREEKVLHKYKEQRGKIAAEMTNKNTNDKTSISAAS